MAIQGANGCPKGQLLRGHLGIGGAKRVKIMDMGTGEPLDEFGAFAEEVLNAGGLPQTLLEQLGLHETAQDRSPHRTEIISPEDFLEQVYRFQE